MIIDQPSLYVLLLCKVYLPKTHEEDEVDNAKAHQILSQHSVEDS